MGGVAVDETARTSLEGLWAIGECAATGAHGANRLASNSLLEAVVFGARAAVDVDAAATGAKQLSPVHALGEQAPLSLHALATLRQTMTRNVGIERNADSLRDALVTIERLEHAGGNDADLKNMTAAARLIAAAALKREESRGGHFRSDYPKSSEVWRHRTFISLDEARAVAVAAPAPVRAAR
jgi:L-aspartate oxidase